MDFNTVKRGLDNISSLYSSMLLEDNFLAHEKIVSWKGHRPGILKNIVYAAEYQKLLDEKQYSFLLKDNSFFQFYYEWKDEKIKSARLCYYPAPVKINGTLDNLRELAEESGIDLIQEIYFGAETWVDLGIDVVNTSHIRLDYDSNVTSHSKCHLQFASFNCFRISSSVLLNPFIFFEWIFMHINTGAQKEISNKKTYPSIAKVHYRKNSEIDVLEKGLPMLSIKK
ncbi:DUF2290 domain-containing protein [Neptuniibacter sp. CAU 1671]|uniref:DUF2290 domain-containing protein n=1 Tax=Neptuniibacter sp. CAU 1671 TaxID=3032593 RepID=UPI0023DC1ADF|nr:DUF2290 domain-containing protein [Neptuniibacter sp. CAU 1671]MDF2180599.1 DUF2290 domain-containing protein [Neptuniibacter sp. CAU 1671]